MSQALLLVEDDPSVRLTLSVLLEDEGYRVELAASCAEGRALLERSSLRYVAVLLDYALADGYGTELLELIRSKQPQAKVVLLSGTSGHDASPRGCDAQLPKGLHFPDLLSRLQALLPERPAAGPLRLSRILVPVDFSQHSANALAFAVALGAREGAEIDILNVWHSDLSTPVTQAREQAKGALRQFVDGLDLRGNVELRRRIEHGDPYMTIQRVVQLTRFDLIVVAGPEPAWVAADSLSRSLLATAPVPVLLVPPHCRVTLRSQAERVLALRRVLVPLTLAGPKLEALAVAEWLARDDGATVEVLLGSEVDALALTRFRERAGRHGLEEQREPGEVASALERRTRAQRFELCVFSGKRGVLGARSVDVGLGRVASSLSCPSLCLPA